LKFPSAGLEERHHPLRETKGRGVDLQINTEGYDLHNLKMIEFSEQEYKLARDNLDAVAAVNLSRRAVGC
jgi:hypothetical protein